MFKKVVVFTLVCLLTTASLLAVNQNQEEGSVSNANVNINTHHKAVADTNNDEIAGQQKMDMHNNKKIQKLIDDIDKDAENSQQLNKQKQSTPALNNASSISRKDIQMEIQKAAPKKDTDDKLPQNDKIDKANMKGEYGGNSKVNKEIDDLTNKLDSMN